MPNQFKQLMRNSKHQMNNKDLDNSVEINEKLFEKGFDQFENGDWDEALKTFEEVLRYDYRITECLGYLITIHFDSMEYQGKFLLI